MVAESARVQRLGTALVLMMAFEIALWSYQGGLVGHPLGWLAGAGIALVAYVVLRGPIERRLAFALRRRLERRGFGVPHALSVARKPWGLELESADGRLQVAWSLVPRAPRGGYWIGPAFYLPDRPPVPELLEPPLEPAPFPPPPPGMRAWTFDREAWLASRRVAGMVGWRGNLVISLVLWVPLTLAVVSEAAWGGVTGPLWLMVLPIAVWRLVVHLAQGWSWIRAGRMSSAQMAHVGPGGVTSGVPGSMRTTTPWSRIVSRRDQGNFVFFKLGRGNWHMLPAAAVPDEALAWFRQGQEARRGPRLAPTMPVARENPFEPPLDAVSLRASGPEPENEP